MASKLPSRLTPRLYLDQHQDELTAFLQKIIRLRTVNPPGENYGAITQLLATSLRDLGLQVRRLPVPRAFQNKALPGLFGYPRYNVIGFWNSGFEIQNKCLMFL